MTEVLCLDANVLVKLLVLEYPPELNAAARRLLDQVDAGAVLVAPAFAWAEVGSALRKKARTGELTETRTREHWDAFLSYGIEYLDSPEIRLRAWEIAADYGLPTLYDAAFLACTELAPVEEPGSREFWTADGTLLQQLGDRRPSYVHRLGG